MTKILATLGPASDGKNLFHLVKKSHFVRLNMSHNTLDWHKKKIDEIKKINREKLILVDIPGIKPRTLNKESIFIKKGQIVKFGKINNIKGNFLKIPLSNTIPKAQKNTKYFSISDGMYQFKFLSLIKDVLTGVSTQDFTLRLKKGLNIPMSNYDNESQKKKYIDFLKKIENFKFDCVGLSFIQDHTTIKLLRKKFPNKLFISKIENNLGYKNRVEIIKNSDAIMIDRGDLAAEVGVSNLTEYADKIISDAKYFGKPVIIATENLNSLIHESSPTKSDVTNVDYYVNKKVDFIMLSDETATSKNWRKTINWLEEYLKKRINVNKKKTDKINIEHIVSNLRDQTIVIFSKKGFLYEKISTEQFENLIMITENKNLIKKTQLKTNHIVFYEKFPRKMLYDFLYKCINKNKKKIFKKTNYAYLVNVIFPRRYSRANSISIIQKKDFF